MPKSKLPKYEFDLMDNSIERVINTTIHILTRIAPHTKGSLHEDVSINLDDWLNLRETTTHHWNEARNAVFTREYAKTKEPAK